MNRTVSVEMRLYQLHYITEILGGLTEVSSLATLEEKSDDSLGEEGITILDELIRIHQSDDNYSYDTFLTLADQLEENLTYMYLEQAIGKTEKLAVIGEFLFCIVRVIICSKSPRYERSSVIRF